ncbi:MAG: CHAP domain-containing protein [Aequoribacter sp.]|uniref:CHAP domain-containing protein n=1 Tax=Aequoribacter sp. TaxID=2847771 RepID=UPI003C334EA2
MKEGRHIAWAAKSQLWVEEQSGRNDGDQVEMYLGGPRERGLPWCAAFALWCCRIGGAQVEQTRPEFYAMRNVQALMDKAVERGQFVDKGGRPEVGDIVFFRGRSGSDGGRGNHCGIVTEVSGPLIVTVEGNLGNRVGERQHMRDNDLIAGYYRPRFDP